MKTDGSEVDTKAFDHGIDHGEISGDDTTGGGRPRPRRRTYLELAAGFEGDAAPAGKGIEILQGPAQGVMVDTRDAPGGGDQVPFELDADLAVLSGRKTSFSYEGFDVGRAQAAMGCGHPPLYR
jgi:hypothetical protein